MPRYKLIVEYDGTHIFGWQRQVDTPTGQGFLEKAIEDFCGEVVTVHCAGRTDAGVHATGQVVHFDLVKEWDAFRVMDALNAHLRFTPLSVLHTELVGEDFHARFSAVGRRYVYRIINRRAPLTIDANRAWQVTAPLNVAAMQDAAQILVGTHDFSSFRASECQSKSPVKTLDELRFESNGNEILMHTAARSFLHHQVRNMIGTLVMVGQGKWDKTNLKEALDAKNRSKGGPTAPPDGLYLTHVYY
ncbi:MAG: tRNA pseudouridine(38-40) synthase TruA [Alphaproteobacteria bacterium]|nr:tRNA pseudouridine(38-40) synthase TruA [Alphaproteobacteria bacterium]